LPVSATAPVQRPGLGDARPSGWPPRPDLWLQDYTIQVPDLIGDSRSVILLDAMRRALLILIVALPALAAEPLPLVPREPYAKAHVSWMVRAQSGVREARLAEVDVWAEGTRLRARVKGEPQAGEFWVDGLSAEALRLVAGKPSEPRKHTLEHALQLALSRSPSLANANSDRIAGHPCKIVAEELPGGSTMSRCIWRGLPLSVEIHAGNFAFNAAATMVDEGAVTVADLQPPPGAPPAPASMSAGR
jgi:hypothetical protein